jgi:hypothetical protein
MCFSERISLLAFIFGIIGSILVYTLGGPSNKIISLFFAFVSLMQLIEFFLWRHQICDNYNKLLSKIGMLLNHLQPFILGLLVIIFNNKNSNIYYIYLILFLYSCGIIPYSLQYKNINNLQCTILNIKTQHLSWEWNKLNYGAIIYTLFFCTALISIFYIGLPNKILKINAIIIIIITYLSSAIIYRNHVGSLWCFYTVFIPIIYYLYCKIFNKFIGV